MPSWATELTCSVPVTVVVPMPATTTLSRVSSKQSIGWENVTAIVPPLTSAVPEAPSGAVTGTWHEVGGQADPSACSSRVYVSPVP